MTLFWALVTGLSWTAIGVVLSRCARNDFDVAAYSILQAITACCLCLWFYADFHAEFTIQNYLLLALVILPAAAINAFAQYLVKYAMGRGNPSAVWAMAQAAMIFPFLTGIFLFGSSSTVWNWCGIFMLLAGIILPAAGGFKEVRHWFIPALCAMFVYGGFQSLYLIPSHCALMRDPLSLRPAMVCFGNLIGWSMVSAIRPERIHFSRTAVFVALIMAGIHVCGVKTFFFALDGFAALHLGGLAMPFMLGINLLGFSIYSMIFLKEKRRWKDAVSIVLILAGLILLGIQTA